MRIARTFFFSAALAGIWLSINGSAQVNGGAPGTVRQPGVPRVNQPFSPSLGTNFAPALGTPPGINGQPNGTVLTPPKPVLTPPGPVLTPPSPALTPSAPALTPTTTAVDQPGSGLPPGAVVIPNPNGTFNIVTPQGGVVGGLGATNFGTAMGLGTNGIPASRTNFINRTNSNQSPF